MTQSTTNAQTTPAPTTFVPADVLTALGSMTRDQADAHDFGIVRLDDTGRITLYNRYESEQGGIPVKTAEGKIFFTQVAPCTNNALFYGAFKKGVAAGTLNTVFPYTFTFKMRPTNVNVHMYRDQPSATNWVFIARL